jgi:hypothetical protein
MLSVERFNQLAAGGDMNAIIMNAVAAQQPPRRVAPGQAGLLQPVDRSSHRGRLTLERVGEDANLERAAVVQQQPEGASEQGLVIRWLLGKRQGVGTVGHDRSLTTRYFQRY